MLAWSGWFRAYLSSAEELGASSSLIDGVEVPCAVPFEVLEYAACTRAAFS